MTKERRSGLNFYEALTLVLVACKLVGVIDWGWLVVFCPILIPLFIAIIYVLVQGNRGSKKGE